MRSVSEMQKELIDIIEHADKKQLEALYKVLVEPLKNWQGFELTYEQQGELDEQKRLHKSGKSKSYTLAQARAIALKKLKK